jgi:hypothetical protein
VKGANWSQVMSTNLNLNVLSQPMTKKPLKRNLYTYQLLGTIQSKTKRQNPKHSTPFYQLNITCLNNPAIKKLFAFQSKLKNEAI